MRTRVAPDVERKVRQNPQVRQDVGKATNAVVQEARLRAPKRTGAGAASIHAEEQPNGSQRVSWDRAHDYMRFPEFGTEDMPAQGFLRAAAKAPERH